MSSTLKAMVKKISVDPFRAIGKEIDNARLRAYLSYSGQAASDAIKSMITGTSPAMICRIGTGELNTLVRYRMYLQGKERFQTGDYAGLDEIAGFFPVTEAMIDRYYWRMIQDIQIVDILGSWLKEELLFKRELSCAKRCPLPDLEPYYHERPWSAGLMGKRVLVVHPFEESIRKQYARRKELFQNSDVLPDFELITLRAVQSLGSAHDRLKFKDWFEALESMEGRISALKFDIALLGCGAYGLPLAAHVKRLGKKAVHLGGSTQILFGIRGKRWESIPGIARLFRESWIRPSEEERPDNFRQIEGGSYW